MNKMMSLVAALGIFAAANSANAISLRFKFKTYSSGPSIYACNAGIQTPTTNVKVCYFEGTTNSCTPNNCDSAKAICDTRCVCTGDNGGDYLMNYGVAQYETWKDNGVQGTGGYTSAKIQSDSSGNNNWTKIFKDNTSGRNVANDNLSPFDHRISNLSFNLGSELYGAEYFVDICYRGPQIEYFADNMWAHFGLTAQVTATDFIANGVNQGDNNPGGRTNELDLDPNIKYTELAGLSVRSVVVCDLQGKGDYQFAHVGGQYNTTVNEADFNSSMNGPKHSQEKFISTSATSFAGNSKSLLTSADINGNDTHTPRFCKVRYIFKETNAATGTIKNLRKWQRHGAEMCTYTNIEEGVK